MRLPTWTEAQSDEVEEQADSVAPHVEELGPQVRELLLGALANSALVGAGLVIPPSDTALVLEPDRSLARALGALLGQPPVASSDALVHAVAMHHAGGLTTRKGLQPLLRPLRDAFDAADVTIPSRGHPGPGRGGRRGDVAISITEIEARHESGIKGRQLQKEAHDVYKMLIRIRASGGAAPVRQPWVLKPAMLGVNLLVPGDWMTGGGEFDFVGADL